MLASVFVSEGVGVLRDRSAPEPKQESVLAPLARRVRFLPQDARQLAQVNASVQVGAAVLLALGRMPRTSSLVLAATLVPSTLDAHRFWTVEDPEERAVQREHFLKNVSLMGALLLAAADTHGRPSLAYRARGARHRAATDATGVGHAVAARVGDAAEAAHGMASRAEGATEGAREALGRAAAAVAETAAGLGHELGEAAGAAAKTAGAAAHSVAKSAGPAAHSVAKTAGSAAHSAAGGLQEATGSLRRHLA